MIRGCVYVRVSTLAQGEDGSSLATQMAACRAYAREHEIEVPPERELIEMRSGAELYERPELSRLREWMKAREIDAVICYAVDRLSRSQIHLGMLLTEAEHARVTVHFVTEPLERTAIGMFLQQARAFAAELEREKIRERAMRGKRARIASGKVFNYGTHLYGYRTDREAGVRVVCEAEAAVVRDLFAWAGDDGVSLREIVRRLNDANVPPPGTGKYAYKEDRRRYWATGQIHRMLRNPAYTGDAYALRYTADHHKQGTKQFRPRDEWIPLPGTTPPIVDAALWERVQKRLDVNAGEKTRNATNPRLLRGMVICAVCGRRMTTERTAHGKAIYRCTSRLTPVGACGAGMVDAEAVEAAAWERMERALLSVSLLKAVAARPRAVGEVSRRRKQLAAEMARIAATQERLIDKFGASDDPDFPWAMVEKRIAALQGERARIAADLADLPDAEPAPVPLTQDATRLTRHARANLPTLTFEERYEVMRTFEVRVTARGKAWTVYSGALGRDL